MQTPLLSKENSPIAIVGGGLAGLSAAISLADRGLAVELIEARQSLGGRAGSYRDTDSGELIDHCQHVALGGCTNFLDLCARTGCAKLLERHQRLYFFSATGERSDFAAARWLPAPLHLLPTLLRMKHLSWRDRWCIGWAMRQLMRTADKLPLSIATWLAQQRQTPAVIERFWKVVLVSALADSLEHISYTAARQVFIKGFLAHRSAADVLIPSVSLGELYDQRMATWLREQGVLISCGEPVQEISRGAGNELRVRTAVREITAAAVICAIPWQLVRKLLSPSLLAELPGLAQLDDFSSSPIASVHLWTDQPIMNLPHAVLIERLSQWVFARRTSSPGEFGYQVVISGEHALSGQPKQMIIEEVWRDLQAVFPAARAAHLIRAKLITQREAVFREPVGGQAMAHLSESSAVPNLIFAGDWLNDGWYATMEGAVRSGYRAAERVLKQLRGAEHRILQPDLPRGWLAKLLIR